MPHLSSTSRKWTTVDCDVYPPGRIGHTFCANADGTKAYVYGGVNDTEDTTGNYLDDYWEYNVITKKWAEKPLAGERQYPRAFHTAVWYRNKMFFFGGCNGRGRFNKLYTIDENGVCENALTRITVPPSTRYCHSAVVFESSMYVFAGKCGGRNSNKRLADLYECNLDYPVWMKCPQIGDAPPPRSAHAAMTHERTMMISGGRNAEGHCCEDFYMYHFDTHVWRAITTHGPTLFGRARNSAIVHYGNVVVFGGWNGKKKLNDLFVYNVEANIFEVAYDADLACPSRRECHVAVVCRNTMVIFGGRFRGQFMSDTSELYLGAKTAADSARDWLLAANERGEGRTMLSLPRQLRAAYMIHNSLHRPLEGGGGGQPPRVDGPQLPPPPAAVAP